MIIIDERQQILLMLKALADESRLAVVCVLGSGERSVGDLAEQVELSEPTVSHHLTRLREAGLVSLRTAGTQRYYSLNTSGMARFKHLAEKIESIQPLPPPEQCDDPTWIRALGWSEEDQKVLRDTTCNGKLTRLPKGPKKTEVVLRWLATFFEAERLYSEQEVNEVLKDKYAEDYVSLRRDLVDFGYLRRERGGGKYWLAPAEESGPRQ